MCFADFNQNQYCTACTLMTQFHSLIIMLRTSSKSSASSFLASSHKRASNFCPIFDSEKIRRNWILTWIIRRWSLNLFVDFALNRWLTESKQRQTRTKASRAGFHSTCYPTIRSWNKRWISPSRISRTMMMSWMS